MITSQSPRLAAGCFLAVEILPVLVSPKVKDLLGCGSQGGSAVQSQGARDSGGATQRQIVEGDIGIGSDTLGKRECDRAGGSRNIDLIGSANCRSDTGVG